MLMDVCVFPGASPTVISTPTPVTVHPDPHPPQIPLPVLEHAPPQVHTHLSLSRNKCTSLTTTETHCLVSPYTYFLFPVSGFGGTKRR